MWTEGKQASSKILGALGAREICVYYLAMIEVNAVPICGRAWGNVADVRRAEISWRFICGERPLTA